MDVDTVFFYLRIFLYIIVTLVAIWLFWYHHKIMSGLKKDLDDFNKETSDGLKAIENDLEESGDYEELEEVRDLRKEFEKPYNDL